MEGRFVNIIIPGSEKTLTLCEVEVYGAKDGMNGKKLVNKIKESNLILVR